MSAPKTLFDKIWDAHVVHRQDDGTCLIYIDRHLVHEVTSPQAFEGLRMAGRKVRAPEKTIAVPDHNVPTTAGRDNPDQMPEDSRIQVAALDKNAKDFGIHYYPVDDVRQGIVHIVGPEQGWTLPGMTVVCGDSHTATHGAFGALAHGIGTSEVEHVLATQTLIQKKSKNMKVEITGKLRPGVTAKDITLTVIGRTGTAGGTGYVIEYCGEAIRDLSVEGRMTVCNMSIEAGARAEPAAQEIGELVAVGAGRARDVAILLGEAEDPDGAVREARVDLALGHVVPLARGELQDGVALVPGELAREALARARRAPAAVLGEAQIDQLGDHGRERVGRLGRGVPRGEEAVLLQAEPGALLGLGGGPRLDGVLLPVARPALARLLVALGHVGHERGVAAEDAVGARGELAQVHAGEQGVVLDEGQIRQPGWKPSDD